MTYFAETDLDTIFADSPHTITVSAVTKPCWFTEADDVQLQQAHGSGQITAEAVATIKTADFPSVKGGDPCTITHTAPNGTQTTVTYTVWRRLRIQDGAATELLLRKV
jgi:hypothetical protein